MTTENEPIRTTIRIEPTGDAWKATEPDAKSELWGRGDNPREAAKNYCELLLAGESDD